MLDNNVFLGELTRKELGEVISNGTIKGAIVPTGATEQHQDHLAMIHDTASVTEIAKRAATNFYPHVLVTSHRPYVGVGASHESRWCVDDTPGNPS